ncbi:MAG: hypothetical protein PUG48_05280 [Clostridia bacterium]|nr:hypothetical protein [Clostridia bacterium]
MTDNGYMVYNCTITDSTQANMAIIAVIIIMSMLVFGILTIEIT